MLEDGLTKFPRAIKSLCRPGALPAVFHCAAGKDRTGMMAMLVLGALEVADEYIVADYALTQDGMARFLQWAVANFPDAYERMTSMPARIVGLKDRGTLAAGMRDGRSLTLPQVRASEPDHYLTAHALNVSVLSNVVSPTMGIVMVPEVSPAAMVERAG